jgi:hypothetical protein
MASIVRRSDDDIDILDVALLPQPRAMGSRTFRHLIVWWIRGSPNPSACEYSSRFKPESAPQLTSAIVISMTSPMRWLSSHAIGRSPV